MGKNSVGCALNIYKLAIIIFIRGENIDDEAKEIVYASIRKHGDDFWNEAGIDPGKSWNGYLFDEILEMLEKDGLCLKVTEHEKV